MPSSTVAESSARGALIESPLPRTHSKISSSSLVLRGTLLSAEQLTAPVAFLSCHPSTKENRLSFVGLFDCAHVSPDSFRTYLKITFNDSNTSKLFIDKGSSPFRQPFSPRISFDENDLLYLRDVLRKPFQTNSSSDFEIGLLFDEESSFSNLTRGKASTRYADVAEFNKRLDDAFYPSIDLSSIILKEMPLQQQQRQQQQQVQQQRARQLPAPVIEVIELPPSDEPTLGDTDGDHSSDLDYTPSSQPAKRKALVASPQSKRKRVGEK